MTTIRIAAFSTDELYTSAIENFGKGFEADFFNSLDQIPAPDTDVIFYDTEISPRPFVAETTLLLAC